MDSHISKGSVLTALISIFIFTAHATGIDEIDIESSNGISSDDRFRASTYEAACQRLRGMADWMNTALRVKNSISKSASERKQARLVGVSTNKSVNGREARNKNRIIDQDNERKSDGDPCASLKTLYSSARVYVQWQTELMKAKAALGGNAIKSRINKLNDTPNSIAKRLGIGLTPMRFLDRTPTELLEGLQVATRALSISLNEQRKRALALIKDAGGSKDFMGYLGNIRDRMILRLNDVVETSESLTKVRKLIQTGESLATLNNAIPTKDEH